MRLGPISRSSRLPRPGPLTESSIAFHDGSGLTANGVTCTVAKSGGSGAVEATTLNGIPCIRMYNMTGGATFTGMQFSASSPINIGAKRTIHALLYCADWLTFAQFSAMRIQFDNGSGGTDTTNYLNCSATTTSWIDGNWFMLTAQFDETSETSSMMAKVGTAATVNGYVTTGNVRVVLLRVNGDSIPDLYCAGIWFGGKTRPRVMLGYDGSYASQKTQALALHRRYGIPGTLYVAKMQLGNAGYLADRDLDAFYADGWAIAMHSYASTNGYNNTTDYPNTQAIVDAIGAFQDWQTRRGYLRGLGHACWPYVAPISMTTGERAVVMPAILQAGLKTMRNAQTLNPLSVKTRAVNFRLERPKSLYAPQLQTNGTPITVATALQRFLDTSRAGGVGMQYIHEITPNGSTSGGDGITNSVGANYWRDDFYASFMASLNANIASGLYDAATVAEYDQ